MRFSPKHLLTAPKTVVGLLLLLLCSVILSTVIPQEFSTPASSLALWREAHPFWQPIIQKFALDRLFTSPWFAGLLFLLLISLAVTTYDQVQVSYKKMFDGNIRHRQEGSTLAATAEQFEVFSHEKTIASALKEAGYYKIGRKDTADRFLKHPWGYWGLPLLHLGLFVTIAAALLLVATQKEGVLRLSEKETHTPTSPWLYEDYGLFAKSFILPVAVRLESVVPEFWSEGGLKNISSNLVFIKPSGQTTEMTTSTGSILQYNGLRIYQENEFGTNFHLLLTDRAGNKGIVVLDIASPTTLDKASYGNFDFQEIPYHIKAKYYADAAGKTLSGNNPLLVIRLLAGNEVRGELSLRRGESGPLGPYEAKLVEITRWTGLIFWEKTGMPGIFGGIFIFSLGSLLYYFTIPREMYCQKLGNGYRLSWRCSRFRDHYREEYRALRERLQGTERS